MCVCECGCVCVFVSLHFIKSVTHNHSTLSTLGGATGACLSISHLCMSECVCVCGSHNVPLASLGLFICLLRWPIIRKCKKYFALRLPTRAPRIHQCFVRQLSQTKHGPRPRPIARRPVTPTRSRILICTSSINSEVAQNCWPKDNARWLIWQRVRDMLL